MASLIRVVSEQDIIGAVARGWTHPENSSKIVDEDLAYAIIKEVWREVTGEEFDGVTP